MKLGKKIIIVLLFIIGIAGLLVGSIAYYRIVVSGSITGNTGNAVFVLRDTTDGESWNNKVINLGQINPGDSGSFDVVMDASGSTVDMYATLSIDRGTGDTELPTNFKFYTTSDHKSELHKYYSFLEKSGTNKETLTIYWYWNPYIDDVEDIKYINKSFNASINVSAVQISEYAMMKNGTGWGINPEGTEFWNKNYKKYIRTITFDNNLSNLPSECTEDNLCWDISYDSSQKKKVYGYLIDSGLTIEETDSSTSTIVNKPLYNLYIISDAPIFAPTSCQAIFSYFTNLISIDFNDNFNTSKVTNMDGVFNHSNLIEKLDLNSFNTSQVNTKMAWMFWRCTSLRELYIDNFNTFKVTNMIQMFAGCSSLTNLDLSSFNTSNVTNMSSMFSECSSLTNLDLSSFNTSNVTIIGNMFDRCSSLTDLDVSSFNTSKVTNMNGMFQNCSSLTALNLSNFNTSNVTSMHDMFNGCLSLTNIDLSSFNTSKVTNMSGMFASCESLTSLNLSNFNTSKVVQFGSTASNTIGEGVFSNCYNLITTINIMNANVTYYVRMFSGAATADGAQITVNYIAQLDVIAEGETQSLIDKMIATKSSNSNVIKGSIIS